MGTTGPKLLGLVQSPSVDSKSALSSMSVGSLTLSPRQSLREHVWWPRWVASNFGGLKPYSFFLLLPPLLHSQAFWGSRQQGVNSFALLDSPNTTGKLLGH